MAKRMRSTKRDAIVIPNRSPRLRSSYFIPYRLKPVDLSVFEDRRTFYPSTERVGRPALSFTNRAASRVVLKSKSRPFRFPDVFGFRVPNVVAICVRRKIRREVMHALDLTRKGAGGSKRRNEWSGVKC